MKTYTNPSKTSRNAKPFLAVHSKGSASALISNSLRPTPKAKQGGETFRNALPKSDNKTNMSYMSELNKQTHQPNYSSKDSLFGSYKTSSTMNTTSVQHSEENIKVVVRLRPMSTSVSFNHVDQSYRNKQILRTKTKCIIAYHFNFHIYRIN